ncbi:MAG: 1-deoxy-D-xylulose-5-phosphate synthase, partial [Puniceicoccales bacterium]|nr:1-deoxy-D-xylulose-5-phosphate synthase [Puniceicoccales bacterium]
MKSASCLWLREIFNWEWASIRLAMGGGGHWAQAKGYFVCDLRRCTESEFVKLAERLRRRIIAVAEENGGHLASNLGAVELSIALHSVFDISVDRIVFDVSHQCYAHKLLSGRDGARFTSMRKSGGYGGYCDCRESDCDPFTSGHGGAALSAALGLAVGRDKSNGSCHVVAVLGDGSLSCGLTQEAFQHVTTATSRLIVVINDNGYAIDQSVGAWAKHLSESNLIWNAFRNLYGLDYFGPVDGHDFGQLIPALELAKMAERPVLVHIKTQKGRGHRLAERAPNEFHSLCPRKRDGISLTAENSYADALGLNLCQLAARDPSIVAVSAAMAMGTGLDKFAKQFPDRFFDVAMAEGHALTFAAGLAKGGLKPICAIYSTFAQRAVDNFFHDICLQNLPVILCLDRAGLSCFDGDTHHGLFDMALFSSFQNCIVAQPSSLEGFGSMLRGAIQWQRPAVIRYGRGVAGTLPSAAELPRAVSVGSAEVIVDGEDISLWALGQRRVEQAMELAKLLKLKGISAEVVDGRFAKPIDRKTLAKSSQRKLLISMEDHVATGGFGSQLSMELSAMCLAVNFMAVAWPMPVGFAESNAILERRCGQTTEQIFAKIILRWNELVRRKSSRMDKERAEAHGGEDDVQQHEIHLGRIGEDGLADEDK